MRLGRDHFVFTEGEPCRSLYILESGRVKCYRANAAGRDQILKVFDRRGDTFCLTSAFNAGTHREVIRMRYDDFEKLVQPKQLRFAVPIH